MNIVYLSMFPGDRDSEPEIERERESVCVGGGGGGTQSLSKHLEKTFLEATFCFLIIIKLGMPLSLLKVQGI